MTAQRIAHHEIARVISRRLSVLFLVVLLLSLGTSGYYLLEIGLKKQQEERVRPIVKSGLSLDESNRFDERFFEQNFRWPWQENEPYQGDEIKFAEMWSRNNIIAELLLDYYYCTSSNYCSLVWLLGSLKRGVSYWENAVRSAVHGDANNDGISNYDSLVGPNADVLNALTPNPVTTYALEKNLSKEIIKRLKSFEMDGQMSDWEKKVIDLILSHNTSEARLEWLVEDFEPNPATIYALEQNLPNDEIERVEPLGGDDHLSEWERYIIDHVEELPPVYVDWAIEKAVERRGLTDWERFFVNYVGKLFDFFIEQVLNDGYVSYEEWMQTRFLTRFGREYLEEKGEEWINDPDLDGDGFTNEFEVSVSFSDPYVGNERYAIFAYSRDLALLWKDQTRAVEEFLALNPSSSDPNIRTLEGKPYSGFKEGNIYHLCDENMTYENFRQVIFDLADRLDGEDIVLFLLAGHGEEKRIAFSDGIISYMAISEELARLKAKVLICTVDACYSGSAITCLKSADRIVMASSADNEKTYGGMLCYSFFTAMQNKSNDRDDNGYCSVLESFSGARMSLESKFENHPQLSNETLAEETYLIELYVGEQRS